ncbi:3',5'-cyclic AMP phosphodiesterase CpdA [Bradyrhizobium sp. JR6.1]
MHHNPFPTHITPVDRIGLLDDAAFRSIVAKHRSKIQHIFFGHCHMVLSGSVAGVPTTSLRGTNHASYPVFAEVLTVAELPYGVASIGADYVTVHMVSSATAATSSARIRPARQSLGSVLRRRRRPGVVAAFRRRHQALAFPLLHKLVVFGGAPPGWSVCGQTAGPGRNVVGHTGRDLLVHGAASPECAGREHQGNQDRNVASEDRHWR